jgi:ketosteroid isomerase-like protein
MITQTEIAHLFSNGRFEEAYAFIAEDAEWIVAGENTFAGKPAILAQCEQVSGYFKTVTTDFNTLHIIADTNKVAVSGTAAFLKDNKLLSFVHACDIYEFNPGGLVQRITSYCIGEKQ